MRQGIIYSGGCTLGCMKLQINAFDKGAMNKRDAAIASACGNRFVIPLDFKVLDSMIPCRHLGLGNRLCYKITFNNYDGVIISPGSPASQMPVQDYGYVLRV